MRTSRRDVWIAAGFAALSVALKLSIVHYGLPRALNPDEPYILKDPFKLTFLYASGDFSSPTNLYFWVLQGWYGLVWLGGLATSQWQSFGEFRNLIASESPVVLLWGRLFAVLCSGAGVYILSLVASRTIADVRLRVSLIALIALNPIDLVSSAWLKFDGPALLVNALLLAALVRYLQQHDDADRRRLYLVALVACSFRIDFAVVLAGLIAYDLYERRPFRPVAWTAATGTALYCAITLMPVAIALRYLGSVSARRAVWVTSTFEENISARVARLTIGDVVHTIVANGWLYAGLLLSLGPILIVAFWPTLRRVARARVALFLFAGLVAPLLVFPPNGTRYVLLPSVYLMFAAVWALETVRRSEIRYGLMALALLSAGSLTLEAIVAVRTHLDPRLEAGRYLLANSAADDVIALENYLNAGYHAEIDECPEELALKAIAVRQAGLGSGETFLLRSQIQPAECRKIVEVSRVDRFARSSHPGRWTNQYDASTLPTWFSSDVDYSRGNSRVRDVEFARSAARRYRLDRVFEPHYADPRLPPLLGGAFYFMTLYVYRSQSPPGTATAPVDGKVNP